MTAPFGSRWQPFEKKCQLRNLIKQYLTGEPHPTAADPKDSVKIMMISDSTDTHLINYFAELLARKAGGNTTAAFRRLFDGGSIQLHDRGRIPVGMIRSLSAQQRNVILYVT